ncbi:helix-turn-helix domain-containing protein [Serratia marcescens]|uniref:helix-turn-helix domain-containing protein n=1 Tax=Serratia marcescens TaxID=615 RepID=UPI001FB724DD|nr:helix-turn-helix domain-containing protein [Serratia marcescens]MCW6023059.1 helix-turn-helix domain-containing protein [Serratia marcescens]UOG72098.1 helix-turn-helix domain-containing protein [Serratia marcescens]
MSMNLMAQAMSIKVGNPLRKLVLIKIADNANDKGECWPSYQHVADHCECSKSAVRAHIEALIKMGLLTKENRLGVNNGKGNTSNLYYLTLDNPVPSESIAPCAVKKHSPMPSKSTGVCQQVTQGVPSESTPPMPADGTRTSHSFEPVNEPKENPPKAPQGDAAAENSSAEAGEVIDFMNEKINGRTPKRADTLREITERLDEGNSAAELKLVAEHRASLLLGDPKMGHMLSAKMIFDAVRFGGYLAAAKAWDRQRNHKAAMAEAVEQQRQEPVVGDAPEIDFDDAFYRLLIEGLQPENPAEKQALQHVQKHGFSSKVEENARREWRVILAKAYARTGGVEV